MDADLKAIFYAITAVFVVHVVEIVYTHTYNDVVARITAGRAYYMAQRLPVQPTISFAPAQVIPVVVVESAIVPISSSILELAPVVSESLVVVVGTSPVSEVVVSTALVTISPSSMILL